MKHRLNWNTDKQTNWTYTGVAALSQVCLHGWSVLVSQIFMRLCTQWQHNDNDTAELCRHHKYYLASIYFLSQMHICLSWRRSDKYLSAFWHHCRPKWDFKLKSLSVVAKFESEVNLCSLSKSQTEQCWLESSLDAEQWAQQIVGCSWMLGRENAFLGWVGAGEKYVWLSFNTIPAKIHTSHEFLTYLKLLTFSV